MKNRFQNREAALLLVFIAILFCGCASIVSRSIYPISVNSNPPGAKITVINKNGFNVYSGNTPAHFHLKAGNGYFSKAAYTINFEMDGYDSRTVPVYFSIDGWYFGNILFGGLIGMLIVDPATGAMWKLDSKFIDTNLTPSLAKDNGPELKVYCYDDIPEAWKGNLVQLTQW